MWRAISVSLLMVSAGCSLSGLDRANLPSCSGDQDCAALAELVDDPDCDTFVCVIETGRCVAARIDRDDDGEPPIACGGTDCNDEDPARYGGATEICNGVDDDCDDLLDGPDEDDDGDLATDLCGGPAVASDCDDTDVYTYFGAPERCDGLDNDCLIDGVSRQGGGARPARDEDRDGDGHAAIDASCVAGPLGEARFFPVDDCDDTRADVYPGAPERCDGLDNDCDGTPDEIDGSSEPGTTCRPTALMAGGENTCVHTRDGDVVCWGQNGNGQLGDAASADDAATVVNAARGLTGLSMNVPGTCGINASGGVDCWGTSYLFEAQPSFRFTAHEPATVLGVNDVVEVSVGGSHGCARTSAGTITCWGNSCPGAHVNGVAESCALSLAPVTVPGIDDAVEIDAGGLMTCARRASGQVWCWGFNPVGRLGTGQDTFVGTAAAVIGIDDAVRVATGGAFACALRASGELWCWGENAGCVGAGCAPMIATAVPVPLDGTVADFVLGGRHGCVLYDDGRFGCWGSNAEGQLAVVDLDVEALMAPRTNTATGVLELAVGSTHTCVRLENEVRCWGDGSEGELGDGRRGTMSAPYAGFLGVPVSVTANAMQIAGGHSGTCFRLPDLSIACIGSNAMGELGASPIPSGVPRMALGPAPAIDIALGFARTMVVRRDGRVSAFGDTRYAAPGTADADGFLVGVTDAVDAACGDQHSCFVRASGEVACIGTVPYGALGDDGAATEMCAYARCARTPVAVVGLERAVSIAAGAHHSCVIRDDGSVACWGQNDRGQTGSLPLGATYLAADVEGLPEGDPAVGLALSDRASCAVLASGTVWCWGEGFGLLSSSFSVDPLPLAGAANVAQIAATSTSLCLRQRSGVVRCVGSNASGELGDGTTTPSDTLRTVTELSDARDLGCGGMHCCATRRGGQTVCWGENGTSQLGNGDNVDRSVPTSVASMLWSF